MACSQRTLPEHFLWKLRENLKTNHSRMYIPERVSKLIISRLAKARSNLTPQRPLLVKFRISIRSDLQDTSQPSQVSSNWPRTTFGELFVPRLSCWIRKGNLLREKFSQSFARWADHGNSVQGQDCSVLPR